LNQTFEKNSGFLIIVKILLTSFYRIRQQYWTLKNTEQMTSIYHKSDEHKPICQRCCWIVVICRRDKTTFLTAFQKVWRI